MMTVEQIRQKSFEKSMRGYRPEEVNAFLAQAAATVEQLLQEKEDSERKMRILAGEVEKYRAQEETIKSALLNAQRLGESVIHEAKQKGDRILREATGKAQLILTTAEEREREERENLRKLEAEVSGFKASVLALYQQHIEALSELDREVGAVHENVFGEEEAAARAAEQAAQDEREEASGEAVPAGSIEEAGSIVDSFRPIDAEEPQQ